MIAVQLPFLVGTVVLAVAGAGKLRHPDGTAQALRTQGLPSHRGLVQALGVLELLTAGAAVAGSSVAAWGVSAFYTGFTGFVLLALLRGRPMSSCGCFGEPDLPPTRTHVGVTALLAVAASTAASSGAVGVPPVLALGPAGALSTFAVTALLCALCLLTLTGLPRLTAARTTIRGAAA